jgi:hypothetical protein
MYFRLGADVADMSQYWEAQNNQHVLTILGEPLSVENDAIDLPFRFNVTYSPGLDGEPKRQTLYDFIPNTNTMHKRLVETLQASGVDNLQTFPAIVSDDATGKESEEYLVVNVLGLMSAADLPASRSQELADVRVFDKLVIDETKAKEQLLFRLAESQIEIIVHERVADAIRGGNFTGVTLEPLA